MIVRPLTLKNGQFEQFNPVVDLLNFGKLNLGSPPTLLIVAATVTIGHQSYYAIDGVAANNDLDTILGGEDGDILVLRNADAARHVKLRSGHGNLVLPSDTNLRHAVDTAILLCSGANWLLLARSNNDP